MKVLKDEGLSLLSSPAFLDEFVDNNDVSYAPQKDSKGYKMG